MSSCTHSDQPQGAKSLKQRAAKLPHLAVFLMLLGLTGCGSTGSSIALDGHDGGPAATSSSNTSSGAEVGSEEVCDALNRLAHAARTAPATPERPVKRAKLPTWSMKLTRDSVCPHEATVTLNQTSTPPPVKEEPSLRGLLKERLNWLGALLRSGAPRDEVTFQDVAGEVLEDGAATLKAEIVHTETWSWSARASDLREPLIESLRTLRKLKIPTLKDAEAAVVCFDAAGLGQEVGFEAEPLATRIDTVLLDEISFTFASKPKVLSVVLEDATGLPLASAQVPIAPRVTIEKAKCGCDVLVRIAPPLEPTSHELTLGAPYAGAWESAERVRAQIGPVGSSVVERLVVKELPAESLKALSNEGTGALLSSLVGEVYGGKIVASSLKRGRRGHSVSISQSYVGDSLTSRAKDLLRTLADRSPSGSDVTKVCMNGGKGTQLASFRLGAGAESMLSEVLTGFEDVDSLLVLDLAKAGLASGGAVLLPEGGDWNTTLQRVKETLQNAPKRVLAASLPKTAGSERRAYVKLPVERLMGEDRNLRIPVELSPSLTIEADDSISFEGSGLALNLPLVGIPGPYLHEVLSALTTPWGTLRKVSVPVSAFSVIENPVDVLLNTNSSGAMRLGVAFESAAGELVKLVEHAAPIALSTRLGGVSDCDVTLAPAARLYETDVIMGRSEHPRLSAPERVRFFDLKKNQLNRRPVVLAPCRKSSGALSTPREGQQLSVCEVLPQPSK